SNSLFEADEGMRDFAKVVTADFVFGPINVQPLDEVNKSATRQKSCPKKSAPAKRVIRTEKRYATDPTGLASLAGSSNLIASVNSDEIPMIKFPSVPAVESAVAPMVQPCLTKFIPARVIAVAQPSPVEVLIALLTNDCGKLEAAKKARIA